MAPRGRRGRSGGGAGGAAETFRRVVGAWGGEDLIEGAFDLQENTPDDVVHVGPLTAHFQLVPHFTRTHAVDFRSALEGGVRFTFGADAGPSEGVDAFACDTYLFIVEATLPEPEPE